MPLLTLHLLRLAPSTSPHTFLDSLRTSTSPPAIILASRPRFLVIAPSHTDTHTLAQKPWDLLLLLQPSGSSGSSSINSIPSSVRALIADEYTLTVGVPSRITQNYAAHNAQLMRDAPSAPLTGALGNATRLPSAQDLEISADLLRGMEELEREYKGPVTQLNLLRFRRGQEGREKYAAYGRGFAEVAGKRGGDAKIVGSVVGEKDGEGWGEVSLVHYPSIRHFCDMVAGEDYQEINHKHRLGVSWSHGFVGAEKG